MEIGWNLWGMLPHLLPQQRIGAATFDPRHNDCMKKVVVYMPDDLLVEIDVEADRTGASRSAVMRDLTYTALRRRRGDRATEMQTLLHHTSPHGGDAAERVKQMRPRDPWVPSEDLRRIRREAPADSGLYADLDVVRRAELET